MTPETTKLDLHAWTVISDHDVEMLRVIRNVCREGFSHDTTIITEGAQREWWAALRGHVKAWLYWIPNDEVIGYGLLRQTPDGRWWSSVAVLPEHEGHGYGGAITADLVRRHDGPVYGEARLDNPAAMRLHRAADWEELGRDATHVRYRTRPHIYNEILADWSQHGVIVQ